MPHARFAQDAETQRIFGMSDDAASRSGLGSILWVLAPLREAKTNVEDVWDGRPDWGSAFWGMPLRDSCADCGKWEDPPLRGF